MLERLLDILLPLGGYTLQLIEAYFDESGSGINSPILCVAGYVFEKDAAIMLDEEWAEVLHKYHLPYFRMSSCAHGTEPFVELKKNGETVQVEKEMIKIIKERASCGIAVTVEPSLYDRIIPQSPNFVREAYTFCLHNCVVGVTEWLEQIKYNGKIAYFFESGHKSQGEANKYMNDLFKIPELKERHRYGSHTFADKKEIKPLQAADLLAWQSFTDYKRLINKKSSRKDFIALKKDNRPPHNILHCNRIMLGKAANAFYYNQYPLTFPWR